MIISHSDAMTELRHVIFFFNIYMYQAKNLQYILPNNTTYKILYPTTKTIPFRAKNNVYQMAT